jgi:crotonobetainyl-CoA:carnitine CoA-transferase CaiB-like acyl-CoA transferase
MERWKIIERVPAPAFASVYGPLTGMRVLCNGTINAAPFAATMLSDFGAEVIQIERPNIGDPGRGQAPQVVNEGKAISAVFIQNGRNRLSFTLNTNLNYPESKEIFLSLIKNVDVWIENMVWIGKLGITDEMLLEVNPKLIICHVSGFGRPQFGGDPEICNKPSYDPIGQAESGSMFLNGFPEPQPVLRSGAFINDYITAIFAAFGIVAAYVNVQNTGQGQVIDVSQAESGARILDDAFSAWINAGWLKKRNGNKVPVFQPGNTYKTKDGKYGLVGAYGRDVYERCLKSMNIDVEEFPYLEAGCSQEAVNSPLGRELERRVEEFVTSHDSHYLYQNFKNFNVPFATARNAQEIYEDPHWHGRNNFVKYVDETLGKEVEAFGIAPKMSKTPGQVWRGAPTLGQDTAAILSRLLGYSDDEIAALKGKGIID